MNKIITRFFVRFSKNLKDLPILLSPFFPILLPSFFLSYPLAFLWFVTIHFPDSFLLKKWFDRIFCQNVCLEHICYVSRKWERKWEGKIYLSSHQKVERGREKSREKNRERERGEMCVSYTFCGSSIFSVLDEFEWVSERSVFVLCLFHCNKTWIHTSGQVTEYIVIECVPSSHSSPLFLSFILSVSLSFSLSFTHSFTLFHFLGYRSVWVTYNGMKYVSLLLCVPNVCMCECVLWLTGAQNMCMKRRNRQWAREWKGEEVRGREESIK